MQAVVETGFPAPAAPPAPSTLPEAPPPAKSTVEKLLRSPSELFADLEARAPAENARALLLVVVLAASVFGAVVGTYRGGIQILYCAIKVPLLLVVTLVVCSPAFVGLGRALRTGLGAREVITITLAACARFALVLAGLAPVVWLLSGWLDYHGVVVTLLFACVVAGLAASSLLFGGLRLTGTGARLAGLSFVVVFALVGSQASWLLRPFLVRPRTTAVPFLRHLEGDLFHAAQSSARSATGAYDAEEGGWIDDVRRRKVAPRAPCERGEGACD